MPRKPTITTLWAAAWRESNVNRTCPGEHLLPHRADVHYVITRRVDDDTAAAYLAAHGSGSSRARRWVPCRSG